MRETGRLGFQLPTGGKGLGAGAKPEIGRDAAFEDRDAIAELIDGADMLFITAGMGGGTGTGAAPVIAQIAKEMGILTVAVVTKPFAFEGKRTKVATDGLEELSKYVDSLIVIPNEKLMEVLGEDVPFLEAFKAANDVLHNAVSGIAEIINCPGLVNVDFADVRTVMSEMGMAMMGSAIATGPDRARIAAEQAVACPRSWKCFSLRIVTMWPKCMSAAVGSTPSFMRRGFPLFKLCLMRSRISSSWMISSTPLMILLIWVSISGNDIPFTFPYVSCRSGLYGQERIDFSGWAPHFQFKVRSWMSL